MPGTYDVFLSYNRQDLAPVQRVAEWLKAQGIRVWFDLWEARPGLPFQDGMAAGIRSTGAGAIFLGPAGMGDWQTPEARALLARAAKDKIPVIPVFLPGCPESLDLSPFLEQLTSVDLRKGFHEEGFRPLYWGITGDSPQPKQPPAPPFLHNLPYPSLGHLFQGREEWLEILHGSLADKSTSATAIAGKALHGLGGVGKTRLAVEYAWRYRAEYSAAFFVGAETPALLRSNLAALAGPALLDLPEQAAPEEEARVNAVLRWLQAHSGWLLILDNVDSEEAAEAVEALLPQLQVGRVLLTGRLAHWSTGIEPQELDLLSEESAIAFLEARTQGRRRAKPDDSQKAIEVSRGLGHLPLALEQAGAAIAERRLTFEEYLREWQEHREKVSLWFDRRVSHYPRSYAVTWQTSVDRISEAARSLLQRLAWLGPEPIPESLLEVAVPGLEDPSGDKDSLGILLELDRYSLVTRSRETPTFTVHRLVQDVTRRAMEGEARYKAIQAALVWVDGAFRGDTQDVRSWPTLEPLAPHARAIVGYADEMGITDPTARLMNDLGVLYQEKALLAEAEPLMRRAVRIFDESLGENHPHAAAALSNLAALLRTTNRLAEAEPLMVRVVTIVQKSLGENDPTFAAALNNLAGLFKATDRVVEAELLMRQVAKICENTLGERHPKVALALNNLAQLLKATDRLAEAEPLMRRALIIDEESSGPEHPSVARDLNNLAQVLQATERLIEAEPLMRRVVTIFEKSLGENHPKVATALNNLAQLFQATNRLAEAEALVRRTLDIDEKSFGPEHPEVASDLNNLARLLQATNRLAEAEPLMRRALNIMIDFRTRTEYAHPRFELIRKNYRLLLAEMGRSEAEIEALVAALSAPAR